MDLDLKDPEVKAAVEAAAAKLSEATTGELNTLKQSVEALQGNNQKLLSEKKEAAEQAKQFKELFDSLGGQEGVQKLTKAQADAEKTAALKMLVEGNFDEFQAAITEKAVGGLKKQLGEISDAKTAAENQRDEMASRYNAKLVDIEVRQAAAKAGVQPTAVEDIVFRALNQFSVKDDAIGVYNKDGVVKLGKDGKTPFSPAEWVEEMREAAPHWWPASQGGGAGGSQGGGGGGTNNPWSKAGWNLTAQGRVVNELGREKAEQMAAAAGSRLGASRPS